MSLVEDPLRCGACGGNLFALAHLKEEKEVRLGGEGAWGSGTGIVATCTSCGCKSTIRVSPVKLTVEGDDKGSLCGGWKK